MSSPAALYETSDELYTPSPLTIGPWDQTAQHGGPPSALIAGAVERFGDDADTFFVTRLAIDLLRPIPLAPLEVKVLPIRLGRTAQWLLASILCEGKTLARATCLRIRTDELSLPARHTDERRPPKLPAEIDASFEFPFFTVDVGYHRAVELRAAQGTWGQGPAFVWFRLRQPLIAGRSTTPLERTMVVADAASGACPVLDPENFLFVNPELTVHLRRPAQGDWIGLDARSIPESSGIGLVQAELFDEQGAFGTCLQSLVIKPRNSG